MNKDQIAAIKEIRKQLLDILWTIPSKTEDYAKVNNLIAGTEDLLGIK